LVFIDREAVQKYSLVVGFTPLLSASGLVLSGFSDVKNLDSDWTI
jgi:hypothetical protein